MTKLLLLYNLTLEGGGVRRYLDLKRGWIDVIRHDAEDGGGELLIVQGWTIEYTLALRRPPAPEEETVTAPSASNERSSDD